MPKTKMSVENDRFKNIAVTIRRHQAYWGYTNDDVGKALGISGVTWGRRLNRPDTITIKELQRVLRLLKIPADVACEIVTTGICT